MLLVVESLCLAFGTVRAAGGAEHVPSVVRALADEGLLEEPERAIVPFLDSDEGRAQVARVGETASREARLYAAFAPRLERSEPTLAEFRRTLPRTLVFAVAATRR